MDQRVHSRRAVLAFLGVTTLSPILAACAQQAPSPSPAATGAAAPSPTAAPAGGTTPPTPPPATPTSPAAQPTTAAATPTVQAGAASSPTPAATAAASTAGPVKLAFQFWDGEPYESTIMKPSGQRYMQAHPNVTIDFQYVNWGGYMPKLLANLAAGTPTDVFWSNLAVALPIVVSNPELFFDLEPLLKQDVQQVNLDDFWPTAKQGSVYNGHYWGLCWGTGATMYLYYNKNLFKDAGLTTPDVLFDQGKWTWDTFLDAAVKLTKRQGNRPVQFGADSLLGQDAFGPLLLAHGGWYMDEGLTKATLNTPEGVAALQFAADMHLKQKVSPGTADKDIDWAKTGKLGMRMTWDGFIPDWRAYTKLFDWDVAPPPAGPKGWKSYATSNLWCMSKSGKHTDVAWDFVKFEVSPAEDLFYAEQYGWVPFRRANLAPWLEGMKKLAPPNNIKYFEPVQNSAILHPLSPAWGASTKPWSNLIVDPVLAGGNVDVKKLADAWDASTDKAIAEFHK